MRNSVNCTRSCARFACAIFCFAQKFDTRGISCLASTEGYEDPTCKVDDINKLIELHSNQFGADVGSELQTNIDTMKDTLDKIGSIIFGGMNYDEINSRILEIVKRVVDLKQQAEIWSPKLHDISNGWVKAQKWISDSQDALGECGAIEKLDEINDLIQRFSQLLSVKAGSYFLIFYVNIN